MIQLPLFEIVVIPPDPHNPSDVTAYVCIHAWNGVRYIFVVPAGMAVLYAAL